MASPSSHKTSRTVLAVAVVTAALAGGGCGNGASSASKQAASTTPATASQAATAPTQSNKLLATVGTTGAEVTLTDSGGRALARLRRGWYTIFVTVNAAGADFHLSGPSVNSATKSKVPGVALWGIHLLKGTYRYMNDHDARTTTHVLSVY